MKLSQKTILLTAVTVTALQINAMEKLTGTPIGCQSVDYSTGQPSNTVHTVDLLFDGDLNTYYGVKPKTRCIC